MYGVRCAVNNVEILLITKYFEIMKNLLKSWRNALYILLTAGLCSCITYKRVWHGEQKPTELQGIAIVITKDNDNVILKDETGWMEQTYYKPIVKKYNVGDTLLFKPCR